MRPMVHSRNDRKEDMGVALEHPQPVVPLTLIGIDESGRGAWAGPMVVGAAIAPDELPVWWQQVIDSKLLSPRQREGIYALLKNIDVRCATGWVTSSEIDVMGMQKAFRMAVRRALENLGHVPNSETLIDGNTTAGVADRCLIAADRIVPAVSAASIIAKVERDRYMTGFAEMTWPGYNFKKHKGYGTGEHRNAIVAKGPCDIHRMSFKPLKTYTREKSRV